MLPKPNRYAVVVMANNPDTILREEGLFGICAYSKPEARDIAVERVCKDGYEYIRVVSCELLDRAGAHNWEHRQTLCYRMHPIGKQF